MIITVISNKIFLIVNFSRNMTRVDQKVSANWDIISLVAQTFATDSQKRESVPNGRNFFFTMDVAPRRASNHGPLHGNYGNKK